MNESGLATVPSAQQAETAAKALAADRATSAQRAGEAAHAAVADTAPKADRATAAVHASRADRAELAADAGTLGGKSPDEFLHPCEQGVPRAVILVDARAEALPQPSRFNCAGGIGVRRLGQGGEYEVRLDGIADGKAIVSAFGTNSSAVVSGRGPTFVVKTFSVKNDELLPREQFTLVVF